MQERCNKSMRLTVESLIAILNKFPKHYRVDIADRDGDVVPMESDHIVNMDIFNSESIQIGA